MAILYHTAILKLLFNTSFVAKFNDRHYFRLYGTYLVYSKPSRHCSLVSVGDSEYDKENRDWTTPKSAKVSCRKRKYYDEDEEELDYVRRKEKVTNKLVIPDDDYLTSADKTPVSH